MSFSFYLFETKKSIKVLASVKSHPHHQKTLAEITPRHTPKPVLLISWYTLIWGI